MDKTPKSEETIFMAAIELPAAERAAYLDKACGGDADLRKAVESLLKSHEEATGFLEKPPAVLGAKETISIVLSAAAKAGDRIGRYKLLQQIGEGGCGVVYMADQTEPVRRQVALKIIKLGMDTKQVIARFEAERQALALMDHPNIAKVLDAGTTETGRPYFVMELVRGIKITKFCDKNNLTTQERLKLFIQVCQAVQHAHQKGIIHRDLKPSNILVTLNDGVPLPKVIDFGIAKATQQPLTDKTLFTAFEQFIGTPAYMSPEQAEMSAQGVDTRSDIYSLGVLLYELLTGKTPFETGKLLQAGVNEIRRIIREEEPQRPSTKLSTMLEGELTVAASQRQTEPPKLIHTVRGDLDWIVMKALDKDRNRRYETANGFARDLERYLADEPVTARPPSELYRIQKMVRRNKLAFTAAGVVVLALLFGLVVSTWLFVRERQIRQVQERLREQAEEINASQAKLLQKAEIRERIAEAKTLYDGQKYDEAEKLLDTIAPSFIESDSIHASVRRGLAWRHVAQNQWNNAATNLAVLLQVDGLDDAEQALSDDNAYAATLVEIGDQAGYERFRRILVRRYASTSDPAIAESVCRISLLLPADNALMNELSLLYDVATQMTFRRNGNMDPKAWNHIALALVDYRRGNYDQAGNWCVGCLAPSQETTRIPTALALRAMIHHQLHQEDDAILELAYAREAIETTFQKELPEDTWYQWIAARILFRQAMALAGDQLSTLKITPLDVQAKVIGAGNQISLHHLADAEKQIKGLPATAIEMEAQETYFLYLQLGLEQLIRGQTQKAADDWGISIFGPNDEGCLGSPWSMAFDSLPYAPLLIELGDKATYEKLRTALLEETGDTDDPNTVNRTLGICLLLPVDPGLQPSINQLADRVRKTRMASSPLFANWIQFTLGSFEYRRGNYAQALQLLPMNPDVQPPELRPVLKATSHVMAAMALYQLHQTNQARLELAQYRGVIETNFNGPLDLGTNTADMYDRLGPWHFWWAAHVSLREAEALIKVAPAPKARAVPGGMTNPPAKDVGAEAN
ncbi:MAG TPA: protein kinase [Candidatus Saccharimonadales bacterium]|nr:protein kinase [Candidatus Saccharimonadales bacterium]